MFILVVEVIGKSRFVISTHITILQKALVLDDNINYLLVHIQSNYLLFLLEVRI